MSRIDITISLLCVLAVLALVAAVMAARPDDDGRFDQAPLPAPTPDAGDTPLAPRMEPEVLEAMAAA